MTREQRFSQHRIQKEGLDHPSLRITRCKHNSIATPCPMDSRYNACPICGKDKQRNKLHPEWDGVPKRAYKKRSEAKALIGLWDGMI